MTGTASQRSTITTLRAALTEMTARLHDAPAQDCAAIAGKIAALGKALADEEQSQREAAQQDAHSPDLRRQFEEEIETMVEACVRERTGAILTRLGLDPALAHGTPKPFAELCALAAPAAKKPRRQPAQKAASKPPIPDA